MEIKLFNSGLISYRTNLQKAGGSVIYPKIGGLSADTVSFGGKNKVMQNMTNEVSVNLSRKVHNEAERFGKDLLWVLKKYLKPLTASENAPNNPICAGDKGIKIRIKTANSIREKASARDIFKGDELRQMGDLIGSRIILRDTSRESFDKVIKQLIKAVKQGDLNIIEIENYRMSPEQSYISAKTLNALEKACKSEFFKRTETQIPSGYTALHLGIKNGKYVGEIQIMGKDVEQLKELEDLPYKIRCGKSLPQVYKSMEKGLKDAINSLDEDKYKIYMQYVKDSYKFARDLAPSDLKSKKRPEFIPIPYFLPKELDFQHIAEMKEICDNAAKKAGRR